MLAANRRSLAGWLVVVGTAAAAALLFWPSAFASEGEQELADSFAVESYAQNCSRCHGLDGQGGEVPTDGRPVPSLRNNDDLTVPYLDLVLLTGRMPPAGDPFDNRERHVFYDDAERQAMVEWMAEEFDIPGEVPEVNEGEVSRGLEVFARNCAHCHGNAGAGGTAGRQAWTPQVNNLPGIAIAEAIRVGPFEMPAFSAEVIPDEDVDAVVAYLEAVDEERGTPFLGLVELNPVFASGFVGLLSLALLGSLVYIGSRPVRLEDLIDEGSQPEAGVTPASGRGGKTDDPDPDDPAEPDQHDQHDQHDEEPRP